MKPSLFRTFLKCGAVLTTLSLVSPSLAQQTPAGPASQQPAASQSVPSATPPAASSGASPVATSPTAPQPLPMPADAGGSGADNAAKALKGVAPSLRELSPWSMFLSADIIVKAVMIGLAFA